MTQEDKELLLKDICGRLPYRLKVQCDYYPHPVTIWYAGNIGEVKFEENGGIKRIETIKPYLRPMTSMTEEEKRKFVSLMNGSAKMTADEEHPKLVFDKTIAIRENGITTVLDYNFEAFDWLNKNMFDYRGLISKGLVLEAPEGMYKIK